MSLVKGPEAALAVLREKETILILGHEEPDGDCLGSQRAMASWLRRLGKQVHLCSSGPWRRTEVDEWTDSFSSTLPRFNGVPEPLVVLLDCSSLARTGFPLSEIPQAPLLIIDHHASGSDAGDVRYVDPQSLSTTLMVQHLIELSGDTPTKNEAQDLFFGFTTDTGFFRHITAGQGAPLESASRLVTAGGSPKEAHKRINGGKTLNSRRLLGRMLERTESYFDGKLMLTWENLEDRKKLGSDRDSDLLYQALQGILGVEGIAIIREQEDNTCTVGLRSSNSLDVGVLASYFGGGGHPKAAGCTIPGQRQEVKKKLLEVFDSLLS